MQSVQGCKREGISGQVMKFRKGKGWSVEKGVAVKVSSEPKATVWCGDEGG